MSAAISEFSNSLNNEEKDANDVPNNGTTIIKSVDNDKNIFINELLK